MEDLPPDPGGIKYIKNHPEKQFSCVVCVICEDVFYKSDFKRLKIGKYLTNVLVICPQHSDIDLTSKYNDNVLSDTVRKIIAQVKLNEQEKVQESIFSHSVRKVSTLRTLE